MVVLHRTLNKVNILININYSKTPNKYDPKISSLKKEKQREIDFKQWNSNEYRCFLTQKGVMF